MANHLRETIEGDLFRYRRATDSRAFLSALIGEPGFRYTYLLRKVDWYRGRKRSLGILPYIFYRLLLNRYRFKYGFDISPTTKIGPGLYIGHFGGIVISPHAVLGANINIAQGCTIGATSRGSRVGAPTLEDRVWVGANSILVGKVTIGREALIAPGAYVNFDVPAKSVVLGNPGKIVAATGSEGYVNNVSPQTYSAIREETTSMTAQLPGDRPPVVVAGAFQTGVVLMRDLRRHKVEVCCVDCDSSKQGFKTVYGKGYLCPNPDTEPAAWAEFMVGLAKSIGQKPVLIPSSDLFVSAIAEHAARLDEYYILRAASVATQALLATKKRQYEIADLNGLPVPKTKLIESVEEVREFAKEAIFPCLMKPLHFREWRNFPEGHPLLNEKIALASSAEELEAKYRLAERVTPSVVLQEIIEGPDTAKMVYLSCYGRGGRRIGSCIVREIRVTPIYFGSASVVAPISDPETHAICDKFFQSIRYEGLCELELKRDVRDGRVRLIEANPRYSVTADAAVYAGVDLGWLHYLDLIGEEVTPAEWNGRHFHHIVLMRDVECFRSYLKAGLATWSDLLKSYRSAVYFDFDLRDWRLTLDTCVYVLKTLLYPALRRLVPKRTKAV